MKKMRLSDNDLEALKQCFKSHFLDGDKLWIFGSRVDITKKGEDIDLYVETKALTHVEAIKRRSDFIWDLEQIIGEQKIDVVLNLTNCPYPLPIHQVALSEGVRIV